MSEDPQREKVRGIGRHDLHGGEREGQRKEERNERKGRTGWLEKKSSRKWEDFQGGQPRQERSRGPEAGGPETGGSPCDVTGRLYGRCPYSNLPLPGFN